MGKTEAPDSRERITANAIRSGRISGRALLEPSPELLDDDPILHMEFAVPTDLTDEQRERLRQHMSKAMHWALVDWLVTNAPYQRKTSGSTRISRT